MEPCRFVNLTFLFVFSMFSFLLYFILRPWNGSSKLNICCHSLIPLIQKENTLTNRKICSHIKRALNFFIEFETLKEWKKNARVSKWRGKAERKKKLRKIKIIFKINKLFSYITSDFFFYRFNYFIYGLNNFKMYNFF